MDAWETPPPEDPYFDGGLEAWVLSRYQDVTAALRDSRLVPVSALSTAPAIAIDSAAHGEFRSQALYALAPLRLHQWEAEFAPLAGTMAVALPTCRPVDLVAEYANPWSLCVAGIAAAVPLHQVEKLSGLARSVFHSACQPYDQALDAAARKATTGLAGFFAGAPPLNMQMFIALAHSLPCFLAGAWLALLQHPARIADLRRNPALLPSAIDELLRFAGPSRTLFRQAVAELPIGSCAIRKHRRVVLRLDAANRDPEQFPAPDELRFDRAPGGHLAFGTGLHACVAATLIRSAAAVATWALIDHWQVSEPYTAVPAHRFGMRCWKSLTVVLQPLSASPV